MAVGHVPALAGAKIEYDASYSWLSGEAMDDLAGKQAKTTKADLQYFIDLRKKYGLPVP